MSPIPETQLALVQDVYAQPLQVKTIPTPPVQPGSALIKILFAPIVSYSKELFDGTREYPYPTPLVPGPSAIGRVAALGADATSLQLDQLVLIDSVIRSRDNPSDIFLFGLTQGRTEGSTKLMRDVWRNGTYANYTSVPLENVHVLNEQILVHQLGYSLQELSMLSRYLVPYGGLVDINLRAGETIVITPATGAFGGAAVAVALAMGANVIAMGRNVASLQGLVEKFGDRVKTVQISNNVDADTSVLKTAANGAIDAVFEISPPMAAQSTHIKSAILALRHGGRVSLMGGIQGDYAIPMNVVMRNNITLKGNFMYERADVISMIRMVEADMLRIGARGGISIAGEYELSAWEEAFEKASREARWDVGVVFRVAEA